MRQLQPVMVMPRIGESRLRRHWTKGALLLAVTAAAVLTWLCGWSSSKPSTCAGSGARGALVHGWKLPLAGANFRAYHTLPWLLGRTFVHSSVSQVVLDAYAELAVSHPELRFVYGETGRQHGGSFRPHRTHQNGLSVDFMVPVRNAGGGVQDLPTSVFAQFGYALEFDDAGSLGELSIDFDALAVHLAAIQRAAARRGVGIRRVIFDAPLRKQLVATTAWPSITRLAFSTKPAWIRHDEHYHIDFDVPCESLSGRE